MPFLTGNGGAASLQIASDDRSATSSDGFGGNYLDYAGKWNQTRFSLQYSRGRNWLYSVIKSESGV